MLTPELRHASALPDLPTYLTCPAFAVFWPPSVSCSRLIGPRSYPCLCPAPSTLRRSREVTRVCSRKVTHQNGDLAQGKCAVLMARTAQRPDRGWDTKTLRAFGADEIATLIPCPRARPVLRVGHSIGAQVGNFS